MREPFKFYLHLSRRHTAISFRVESEIHLPPGDYNLELESSYNTVGGDESVMVYKGEVILGEQKTQNKSARSS